MTPTSWRDRLRIGGLALVAFVLGHDAIFLLTYGDSYDAVLARTGHAEHWTVTVAVVVALAVVLGLIAALRLRQLTTLAGDLDAGRIAIRTGGPGELARSTLRSWPIVFAIALAVFVINENVEHLSMGLPAPGLTVLGSVQYHGTLAIFGAISLVAALVDALYRWRRDVLAARIAAAGGARRPRMASLHVRPSLPWVETRHASIVLNRLAGRAPPEFVAI